MTVLTYSRPQSFTVSLPLTCTTAKRTEKRKRARVGPFMVPESKQESMQSAVPSEFFKLPHPLGPFILIPLTPYCSDLILTVFTRHTGDCGGLSMCFYDYCWVLNHPSTSLIAASSRGLLWKCKALGSRKVSVSKPTFPLLTDREQALNSESQ